MTMKTPLYVSDSHLQLAEQADGTIRLSLSKHLLGLLGCPTFAEISAVPGARLSPGVPFASVETDKTAYDVALPFPAVFAAANPDVVTNPAVLFDSGCGTGWLCDVRPASATDWCEGLLDEDAYASFVAP